MLLEIELELDAPLLGGYTTLLVLSFVKDGLLKHRSYSPQAVLVTCKHATDDIYQRPIVQWQVITLIWIEFCTMKGTTGVPEPSNKAKGKRPIRGQLTSSTPLKSIAPAPGPRPSSTPAAPTPTPGPVPAHSPALSAYLPPAGPSMYIPAAGSPVYMSIPGSPVYIPAAGSTVYGPTTGSPTYIPVTTYPPPASLPSLPAPAPSVPQALPSFADPPFPYQQQTSDSSQLTMSDSSFLLPSTSAPADFGPTDTTTLQEYSLYLPNSSMPTSTSFVDQPVGVTEPAPNDYSYQPSPSLISSSSHARVPLSYTDFESQIDSASVRPSTSMDLDCSDRSLPDVSMNNYDMSHSDVSMSSGPIVKSVPIDKSTTIPGVPPPESFFFCSPCPEENLMLWSVISTPGWSLQRSGRVFDAKVGVFDVTQLHLISSMEDSLHTSIHRKGYVCFNYGFHNNFCVLLIDNPTPTNSRLLEFLDDLEKEYKSIDNVDSDARIEAGLTLLYGNAAVSLPHRASDFLTHQIAPYTPKDKNTWKGLLIQRTLTFFLSFNETVFHIAANHLSNGVSSPVPSPLKVYFLPQEKLLKVAGGFFMEFVAKFDLRRTLEARLLYAAAKVVNSPTSILHPKAREDNYHILGEIPNMELDGVVSRHLQKIGSFVAYHINKAHAARIANISPCLFSMNITDVAIRTHVDSQPAQNLVDVGVIAFNEAMGIARNTSVGWKYGRPEHLGYQFDSKANTMSSWMLL